MAVQFSLTAELTNTHYAPVAALATYYDVQKVLDPLQSVTVALDQGEFRLEEKLIQVMLSLLTGCEYLSEVNTKLRPERQLAQVYRIACFAEQSTLSRALNRLTQMNLSQLAGAVRQISHRCSRTSQHDWRGFLRLDFDLSGLPCGNQAQGSQKGYFSGKKTSLAAN